MEPFFSLSFISRKNKLWNKKCERIFAMSHFISQITVKKKKQGEETLTFHGFEEADFILNCHPVPFLDLPQFILDRVEVSLSPILLQPGRELQIFSPWVVAPVSFFVIYPGHRCVIV